MNPTENSANEPLNEPPRAPSNVPLSATPTEPPNSAPNVTPATRGTLQALLLAALALLCAAVLKPFFVPVIWAAILAFVTWPAFRRLRRAFGAQRTAAAAAMTLLVTLTLLAPLFWLAVLLQNDVTDAYQALSLNELDLMTALAAIVRKLPWLGDWIQPAIDRMAPPRLMVRDLFIDWIQHSRAELLGIVGGAGRNIGKLFIALVTLFFFYRDGPVLAGQVSRVLGRFLGNRLDPYLRTAGLMTRAVIYGLLSTALAQGLMAGIGFAVFGVRAPTMLGVLTAFASLVPVVGTFLVWGSIGAWLIVDGQLWAGVGLLAWGTILVNPADNIIRPLLISNATQLPFLLVMFGVVGGLAAFGLVGLFIGPVALAVAAAIWVEWQQVHPVAAGSSGPR